MIVVGYVLVHLGKYLDRLFLDEGTLGDLMHDHNAVYNKVSLDLMI